MGLGSANYFRSEGEEIPRLLHCTFPQRRKTRFLLRLCQYDFSVFEKEPKLMFRAKYGAIDGDIIYKDGLYHFFYKGNTKDANGVQ